MAHCGVVECFNILLFVEFKLNDLIEVSFKKQEQYIKNVGFFRIE